MRLRDLGHVNRVLSGLRMGGTEPAPSGAKVWRDGKEVGQVTSSVFSPGLSGAIALAYLRRGSSDVGTALEVEMGSMRIPAAVAAFPFSPEKGTPASS